MQMTMFFKFSNLLQWILCWCCLFDIHQTILAQRSTRKERKRDRTVRSNNNINLPNCQRQVEIRAGDTCFSVALANGLSVPTLQSFNPGIQCNNLAIGTALCLQSRNNNQNGGNQPVGNDFCSQFPQLALGDGTQNRQGQCSLTIQGAVPSVDRMVSTLIVQPENAAILNLQQDIQVVIDINNLDTGFFSDPQSQYYATPQELNQNGIIKGHQHITVQRLGGGRGALDAKQFDFFKGLDNQSPDGRTLSATIPAGTLAVAGQYRICSITGTLSHQPVIMPVAQRGSQDDCIRVNLQ